MPVILPRDGRARAPHSGESTASDIAGTMPWSYRSRERWLEMAPIIVVHPVTGSFSLVIPAQAGIQLWQRCSLSAWSSFANEGENS
jgi:hypothetical protein